MSKAKYLVILFFTSTSLYSQEIPELTNLINNAITEKIIPSAQLIVGKGKKILHSRAYGSIDQSVENTTNTLYDLASLTKPVATTSAILLLIQDEKLKLSDKVSRFFPQFDGSVSIEDLLRHRSGLPSITQTKDNFPAFFSRILELKLPPSSQRKTQYSDLGFIILGEIVKLISGENIGQYLKKKLFDPLEMSSTFFSTSLFTHKNCASNLENAPCQVADPINRLYPNDQLGHSGLFSTATDLAKFIRMLLYPDKKILSPFLIDQAIRPRDNQIRGLGWDALSPLALNPRGLIYPPKISFGHTGYTGTMIWVDPQSKSYIIFLSNRNLNVGSPSSRAKFLNLKSALSTAAAKLTLKVNHQ